MKQKEENFNVILLRMMDSDSQRQALNEELLSKLNKWFITWDSNGHFFGKKKIRRPDKSQWLMSQVNTRPLACVATAWFLCLSNPTISPLLSSLIGIQLITFSRLFTHSLQPPSRLHPPSFPPPFPVCNTPLNRCASPPLLFIIPPQTPIT